MTENTKPTCFVIQEFDDGGRFDRRYIETIRPALLSADVEPVRADAILGLQPVIEKIESAIREAAICVAEVSSDNPNVWLELGYALALDRPVVILCDKQLREKLPFDIQHRPVIFYRTDSKSGYEELEKNVVRYVKNQLETAKRIESSTELRTPPGDTKDLKGHEVALLAGLLAMWPSSPQGVGHWELEKRLKKLGYTDTHLALGIARLLDKEYVSRSTESDLDREWFTYRITPEGIAWLQANEDKIEHPKKEPSRFDDIDKDIPF